MYGILVGLLQPFGWLMWGTALGLAWRWWRHPADRVGMRIPSLLFLGVFLFSLPLTAWVTCLVFENHYPRHVSRPLETRVIVVLGGDAIPPATPNGRTQPGMASLLRARRALDLYREGPPCPIIVSGGKPEPSEPGDTPGQTMWEFLREAGVAEADLILEDQSRNTAQNAEFSARILRERGWTGDIVLVTSAAHLWRAAGMFQKQGIEVIPVGCDYRQDEIDGGLFLLWPRASAIGANQACFHEAVGMCLALFRGEI